MKFALYSPSRAQWITRSAHTPIPGLHPYSDWSSEAERYSSQEAALARLVELGLTNSTDATDPLAAYVAHTLN
jgi:hypothetical protein